MIFISIGRSLWEVISHDNNIYNVDTELKTCTYKSWYYSKKPKTCKHLKFLSEKNGI